MVPSQICGCPFREPRVFEIAHIYICLCCDLRVQSYTRLHGIRWGCSSQIGPGFRPKDITRYTRDHRIPIYIGYIPCPIPIPELDHKGKFRIEIINFNFPNSPLKHVETKIVLGENTQKPTGRRPKLISYWY